MIIGGPALTKYNDRSLKDLTTSPASVPSSPGALVHIKTITASSDSTISFVNGSNSVVLDNTYPIYKFEFTNIHPSENDKGIQFNLSTDTGSNYNVAKTTTSFRSRHAEDDSYAVVEYRAGEDLAQSTDFKYITAGQGNGNDEDGAAELFLYNPSSTTFVKHFMSKSIMYYEINAPFNWFMAGYGNTTSAVDAIQFKMNSGNIDNGKIKLFGIKDA